MTLVDHAANCAYHDGKLYAVLAAGGANHVHDALTGRWLGRILPDGIEPALFGVKLAGSARRRKGLRALGAIQRAWYEGER